MSDDYALSDIKTELATMRIQLAEVLKRIDPLLGDHETRLRKLEQKVWIVAGGALTGGGALGTVFSHLTGA